MKASTLNLAQLSKRIPSRPRDSHKGMFGTVVVIGGQSGTVGAALLAARAALQLGTGRVHAVLLAEDAPSVDLLQPELMLHKAAELLHQPSHVAGTHDKDFFAANVLALGCGMGTGLNAQKLLHNAIRSEAVLVLDADALNILAMRPDLRTLLGTRSAPTLLTPHPGEAARLLGCDIRDIQQNRLEKADELRSRYHSSVVLKGVGSVCATSDGKLYVNTTGNPGMSSAGMGDVLTGILAALIAQGMAADDALLLAVHLHGAAGDELAKQNAMLGMSASEVTAWARWLFNRIAKG
jgi:hydroxyethylthiazole kinase-like uncharacterized protein yjeF